MIKIVGRPCTFKEKIELNIRIMKNRIASIKTKLSNDDINEKLYVDSMKLFSDAKI